MRWNLAWVFSGNVVRSVSRAVLLILLVKWGGWEAAGLYVAALALTGPLFAVTDLGLRPLLINDVAREYPYQHYFSLRLLASAAAWLGAIVLGLAMGYYSGRVALVAGVAAARFWDSLSDILHGVLQREERMDCIGIGLSLRHLLGAAAFCIVIALDGSVTWAVLVDALAALAVCLAYDLPNARCLLRGLANHARHGNEVDHGGTDRQRGSTESDVSGSLRNWEIATTRESASVRESTVTRESTISRGTVIGWGSEIAQGKATGACSGGPAMARGLRDAFTVSDRTDREQVRWVRPRRDWGQLVRHSLPLAIVALEINLITNAPRYVVETMLGTAALAIFASLMQLAGTGMIFVVALGQTSSPRLARYFRQGDHRRFFRLLGGMTAISGLLGGIPWMIVASGWGPPILRLLFRDDIAEHWDTAVWVMGAAVFLYLTGPLGRALDTLLRFKTHMAIRSASLILLLVTTPLLTRAYGLWGTAVAFSFSQVVLLPLYLFAIAHAWRHRGEVPRLRQEAETGVETQGSRPAAGIAPEIAVTRPAA